MRDETRVEGGRRRAGALRREFTIAAAVTIGLVLVSSLGLSLLMTISSTAAFVVVGPLGFGALLLVARLLVTPIVGDVEALRREVAEVRLGRRDVSSQPAGPGEREDPDDTPDTTNPRPTRRPSTGPASLDMITVAARDLRGPITSLRRLLAEATDNEITAQMRTQIDALTLLADDLGASADAARSFQPAGAGGAVASRRAVTSMRAQPSSASASLAPRSHARQT
jgi:hypothetical protein